MRAAVASAQASGAEGTPTFFVNGRRLIGRYDADTLAVALAGGDAPPPRAPERSRERASADPVPTTSRRAWTSTTSTEQPADDAYPRLSSAQIETLAAFGERRPFTSGEPLFEAGAEAADFVVVVSGAVALLVGGNTSAASTAPGSFIGELALLRGETLLTTPVGARDGEVVIVPAARFGEALAADLELRDIISRAYLLRRSILLAANASRP